MAEEKPTDEDIKDMIRKTEKENLQVKIPPNEPPKETIRGDSQTEETIGTQSSNQKEVKEPAKTPPKETPDPRDAGLHQRLSILESDIAAIKELVKASVAYGQQQQAKTQETQTETKTTEKEKTDQDKPQEELTTEQEMALLDKARRDKEKRTGVPAGEGPPSKDALIYLSAKLLDSATKSVVAFFQSKAAGGTGEEDAFTKFSKEFTMKSMEGVVAAQAAATARSADVITPTTLKAVSDLFGAIGKLPKPAQKKMTESGEATEEII